MAITMKNLIDAMKGLGAIAVAFFFVLITMLIWPLVAGAISNVATSGDVPVEGNFSAAISNVSAEGAGYVSTIFSQTTIIVGLIAIVVVILAFGLSKMFSKGGKKGGSMY